MTLGIDVKAALKEVQLETAREKLAQAKADRMMAELKAAQLQREEDHFAVNDDMVHQHYFVGAVDGANVNSASQHLAFWHRLDPTCDMSIEIHSGGGSVLAGLNLLGQLRKYSLRGGGKHQLNITVRGIAASMATVLVQPADWRVMDPDAFFMVHELSAATGGKIGEMRDTMKFYEAMNEKIADIYVARSNGKTSREQFNALWTDRDVWMDADETLERGFIDEIEGN